MFAAVPSSRSPGPACRRRSGRRSRPSRGPAPVAIVELGLEGAVAPVHEHGDAVLVVGAVRGRQVRLAVAVQVADRDRVGPLRLRSRAWPGRCRRPCSGARSTVGLSSRRCSRDRPGPACRRRSGRRSRPSPGASGSRSRAWPGSCRRPCSGARRRCPRCARRSRWPGPACRRRSGRRSRPSTGDLRLGSRAWPGSCRRPCSGGRRRCPPRCSRSPGRACRRRSGRRSRPSRSGRPVA